jgi:hypothetical protein
LDRKTGRCLRHHQLFFVLFRLVELALEKPAGFGHAHHLICDAVGLLLVSVAGSADRELGLDRRRSLAGGAAAAAGAGLRTASVARSRELAVACSRANDERRHARRCERWWLVLWRWRGS